MSVLLDPGARLLIGHRGAAAEAPENTLVSFARALDAGADALELDVHLSADGIAVVHHDATLERTTDGRGPIGAHTLSQLRALDAGARFTSDGGVTFPFRGRGVRIPTLEEVLAAFAAVPLIIELKTATASEAARRTLLRQGATSRCVVASFDPRALDPFRNSDFALGATQPEVARLLRVALRGGALSAAPTYALASVPRRWGGFPLPVVRFARLLRSWGRPVHVWTVDDPREGMALWEAGVQGIISNDPAAMQRWWRQHPPAAGGAAT